MDGLLVVSVSCTNILVGGAGAGLNGGGRAGAGLNGGGGARGGAGLGGGADLRGL